MKILLLALLLLSGCSSNETSNKQATRTQSFIKIDDKVYELCNAYSFEGDINKEPSTEDNAFDVVSENIVFGYCSFD